MIAEYKDRWQSARERAAQAGASAVVVSTGPDMAYLTGHDGHSYERLTVAVTAAASTAAPAVLITPTLEARGLQLPPDVVSVRTWGDSEDPISLVASELPTKGRVLISDELAASHLLALQHALPGVDFLALNETTRGLRAIKSTRERAALLTVGSLADEVHRQIQDREVALVGRSELEVQADICERLLAVGHDSVEFAIVAAGPNSANPHHRASDRVIQQDEMVLFDFGGSHHGYHSDTTRCVYTGPIPADVEAAWESLVAAQQAAFEAATPGRRLQDVDRAARDLLTAHGYGPEFIHRVGHGIGTQVHEHPYVTDNNTSIIEVGHAFSIEPGIYRAGEWGMRLEDIVVVEVEGAVRCNQSRRDLVAVC